MAGVSLDCLTVKRSASVSAHPLASKTSAATSERLQGWHHLSLWEMARDRLPGIDYGRCEA